MDEFKVVEEVKPTVSNPIKNTSPVVTAVAAPTKQEPKDVIDFSGLELSNDEVKEVKAIRKSHSTMITQRVVDALAKEFKASRARGYTNGDILLEWANRGWKTYRDEWMKIKPSGQVQSSAVPKVEPVKIELPEKYKGMKQQDIDIAQLIEAQEAGMFAGYSSKGAKKHG